jgi:sterol desaturase/sphingolipid hydroxylase (fatty acid hydroxylase superfamily)
MRQTSTWLAFGAVSWTVAEHLIHDHLGHRHTKSRNPFTREHVAHHATTSYFAATSKKVLAATLVGAGVGPLSCALLGRKRGVAYTAGLLTMYVSYELLHRRAHTHAPKTRYGRWMRKHHFHHHFHNPKMNHGVTSPIWDFAFGSYEEPSAVRVPERHAMTWLVDPVTGEVRDEHSADYQLVRKRRRASEPPASGVDPKGERPAAAPPAA